MTIGKPLLCLFFSFFLPLASKAAQPNYITYENKRMGTLEKPYLLRTYVPSLGLDDEVLSHHSRGFPSPRYSTSSGRLSTSGSYGTIPRHSGRHQRKLRSPVGLRMGYHRMQVTLRLGKRIPRYGEPLGFAPKREAKWKLFSPSIRASLLQGKGKTTFANQREASFRENKLLWKQAHQRASRFLLSSRWTDNHCFSRPGSAAQTVELKINIL